MYKWRPDSISRDSSHSKSLYILMMISVETRIEETLELPFKCVLFTIGILSQTYQILHGEILILKFFFKEPDLL